MVNRICFLSVFCNSSEVTFTSTLIKKLESWAVCSLNSYIPRHIESFSFCEGPASIQVCPASFQRRKVFYLLKMYRLLSRDDLEYRSECFVACQQHSFEQMLSLPNSWYLGKIQFRRANTCAAQIISALYYDFFEFWRILYIYRMYMRPIQTCI